MNRPWIVDPVEHNPWWLVFAAIIPALLATILLFMDQQITLVIINRKENKLVVCVHSLIDPTKPVIEFRNAEVVPAFYWALGTFRFLLL